MAVVKRSAQAIATSMHRSPREARRYRDRNIDRNHGEMHSHNARVEQEEDAMYDYSNGGGIGGIGLGGFGNVQYEEPS